MHERAIVSNGLFLVEKFLFNTEKSDPDSFSIMYSPLCMVANSMVHGGATHVPTVPVTPNVSALDALI